MSEYDDPNWDMAIPARRAWGRHVLIDAWSLIYPGEAASLAALQTLQGMTEGEGWYGYACKPPAWKGSNNWGAISISCANCTEGETCFQAGDHLADGTQYQTCFKMYPDAVSGAADFIKYACSIHGGHDYAMSGDVSAFALALRQPPAYYQGVSTDIPTAAAAYATAIYNRVTSIASDLGEPVSISLDGPAATPTWKWTLAGAALTTAVGGLAWNAGAFDEIADWIRRYVARF